MNENVPLRSVEAVEVETVRDGRRAKRADALAVEEPLEVRVMHGPHPVRAEASLGLTMRTPGHDDELVAGLLLAEGVVRGRDDVVRFRHGRDRDGHPDPNVVVAELDPRLDYDPGAHARVLLTSSACGVCGRASLDALHTRQPPLLARDRPRVPDSVLRTFPALLHEAQKVFARTGGLHAAALFDAAGRLHGLREDVGRHNAVDKLLGSEFLAARLPLLDRALLVSGRASYEILQKARVAGVPFVAAVGAPSSLAVGLAREFDQTLVGFLKSESYNIYAGPERVAP